MSAAERDPFARLVAIDRLEVGAPRLQKRGVTSLYKVVAGGEEKEHEMSYRYEEDVFDPDSPEDSNLASMMTAQLALNYGLFCREIVFRGSFDAADRRFLEDMAANTAREIYVKKLLEPNALLDESVQGLPAVRRKSYVQAKLVFEPDASVPKRGAPRAWQTDPDRFVVSSSGGKDSLLSYGLLNELGYEVSPVFLNESGRHWLTALNAHRHFSQQVPGTSRVWTSSDRMFAAMLRHLPFVRPDFARQRSDEYAIRLWTVAVFLFGTLPLVRKRGAGRLVVGDEHDTTVRMRHAGILHYNGLYDQSRYFDEALTRYYLRKGWGLTQFSILRPLSELYIQNVLAQRYGDLLRLQTSCHATHMEGETVRPCGKCEKCRRIIGMLLALDLDPGLCGYKEAQVERARKDLVATGVSQYRSEAEHLGHMLHSQGLIAEPRLGEIRAHDRPEVVSLRFHPERSPMATMPVALRRPLFTLLQEHGEGALRLVGRSWMPFDVLADPEVEVPYPFDRPLADPENRETSYLWGEMSWPEAKRRLTRTDMAILPVGAVEQHGPHLPLDTDAFDAEYMALEVASRCSDPKPLVLPLVPYGVSYHHEDFPGTISVTNETLARFVYEVGMGAARNGITKLFILNGHGGNSPALHFAAQMINRDAHIFTCVDSGETSDTDVAKIADTPNDVHAGEIETSTTLAVRPHLVRMSRARSSVPSFSSHYLDFTSQRSVGWYARTEKISESGVMGDPEKASAEKGEKIWQVMIANMVELVEHLKGLPLDEIYQRRY